MDEQRMRAAYASAPMSMARYNVGTIEEFVERQRARFGRVMRCGWCKGPLEERREGAMVRYRHAEFAPLCREVLPYQAPS